jgi:hypothetical protein
VPLRTLLLKKKFAIFYTTVQLKAVNITNFKKECVVMKRFFQLIILVMIAMYNAVCVVTGGVHLKKLVPSGVIDQGILGGFSGKVGPVVGGKWKDVDYMRGYVVPSNPNTAGQQAVRSKFAALVADARHLLSTILQPYWDMFYSNMSGYNAWISQNYDLADTDGAIDETAIMSKGTLESSSVVGCTYDSVSGGIGFAFDAVPTGNGLGTDKVVLIVKDTSTEIFYFPDVSAVKRDDGTADGTITTGLTATNLICFVFFYRGTSSEMVVSDSIGAAAVAA